MKNNNSTIIVSGCTKGIGKAICELFAVNGFNIGGYARGAEETRQMQDAFSSRFPLQHFLFTTADAADKKAVGHFGETIKKAFNQVDILVNNAGVFLPGQLHNEADGTLEQLIHTNVYSAYYLTRILLPDMMQRKSGSVFNICSVASLQAYENGGSYCISKFALLGFSKQLREEMKPHQVKVTAVIPGATLTNSWAGSDLPESRFIKAEDVAKTILNIYQLSVHADVEEIVIRPQHGDI